MSWARVRSRIARRVTRGIRTQPRDGIMVCDDWSNVLMGCCDCGLMHKFSFSIDAYGRLVIQGRRDRLATMTVRARQRFAFQPDVTPSQTPHYDP